MYDALPTWYDPTCVLTSVCYATVGYLLGRETNDSRWYVLVGSGIVSSAFRCFRVHQTQTKRCSLRWGHRCNSVGAAMFSVDVLFAFLCIAILFGEMDVALSCPVVGLFVCAWVLHAQSNDLLSSVVHAAAHVVGCATLIKALIEYRTM